MHQVQISTASRDELLLEHYELARRIAYRMYARLPQLVEADDLVSAAVMGLFEAIDRYDPRRAVPFVAFAKHRIRGSIMDAIRAADWTPTSVRRKHDLLSRTHRELIDKLGRAPDRAELINKLEVKPSAYDSLVTDSLIRSVLPLDTPTMDGSDMTLASIIPSDSDTLETLSKQELRDMVQTARANLPVRERQAIDLHYYRDMKLKDVGKELGVTESRACQLCKQGITRLRKRLQPQIH